MQVMKFAIWRLTVNPAFDEGFGDVRRREGVLFFLKKHRVVTLQFQVFDTGHPAFLVRAFPHLAKGDCRHERPKQLFDPADVRIALVEG